MRPIFKTFICAWVALTLAFYTIEAQAQTYKAIVPVGSPFKLSESIGSNGFRFLGSWKVAGKFVIEGYSVDDGEVTPRVVFVPDAVYAKSVPTMRMEWAKTATSGASVRHDNFDVLTFRNDSKAARALVGSRSLQNLLSGQIERIQGRAQIVVSGLHVFGECDRILYMTSFVRVHHDAEKPQMIARARDNLFGC